MPLETMRVKVFNLPLSLG